MGNGGEQTSKYSSEGTVSIKFTQYYFLHVKNFMVTVWLRPLFSTKLYYMYRNDWLYFWNFFLYTHHMEKAYQIFQNNVIVFRKSLNDLFTSGYS